MTCEEFDRISEVGGGSTLPSNARKQLRSCATRAAILTPVSAPGANASRDTGSRWARWTS